MKTLRFLSRVAFLYNACMLLVYLMKWVQLVPEGDLKSTILVAGLGMSVAFNAVVNAWAGGYAVSRLQRNRLQPHWLFAWNACFFIVQLYLLLK